MSRRYQLPLICCALVVLNIAVYFDVTKYPFVSIDDISCVIENPAAKNGLGWHQTVTAFSSLVCANWIPMTWLSHAFDVEFFGMEAPGAHHATSLFLHALNTCLTFLVLSAFFGRKATWRCAAVAALFAVHPTHVETVAWITERKGVLSTTFWWLALAAYAWHTKRPSSVRLALVAAALAASLLSKGMAVSLPAILLLLDHWPLRRLERGETWPRLIVEKIPLVAVALAGMLATFASQDSGGAVNSLDSVPLAARFANATYSYVRYLGMLIWPVNLAVFYPYPSLDALAWGLRTVAAAAALFAATAAAIAVAATRPWWTLGWLWYVITLIPVIGIVKVGEHAISDRYVYIPYTGLFISLVWALAEALRRRAGGKVVLAGLTLLAIIGSSVVARTQVAYWESSFSLWKRAATVTRNPAVAYHQLGRILLAEGRAAEALPFARKSVELEPESAQGRQNLGAVLGQVGDMRGAAAEFEAALEIEPDLPVALHALGLVDYHDGHYESAVRRFADAIARDPALLELGDTRYRYADALRREVATRQVGLQQAMLSYRQAMTLDPSWRVIRWDFAWIMATTPGATEAHAREAASLELDPHGARELEIYAALEAAMGRFDRAEETAAAALELVDAGSRSAVELTEQIEAYRAGERWRAPAGALPPR